MARKRIFGRIAKWIGIVFLALLGLIGIAIASIFTPFGRTWLRDLVNYELHSTFKGDLHIGRIETLHWNGVLRATGLTLCDPQGRLIVTDGEIELTPTSELVSGVWRGLRNRHDAYMPSVSLHLRTLRLLPDPQGAPSIADAFDSRTPAPVAHSAPPPGAPHLFHSIHVVVDRVENQLGQFEAVASHVVLTGRVTTEPLGLTISSAQTEFTSPRTPVIQAQARFDWHSRYEYRPPLYQGVDVGSMVATLDVHGQDLACHLEYQKLGQNTLILARDCSASAAVIDRAAGQTIGIGVEVPNVVATQSIDGTWHAVGSVVANDQSIATDVVMHAQDIVGNLMVTHVNLTRLRESIPTTDLNGIIHAEKHGDRFVLDTNALRAELQGRVIPPVHADAHMHDRVFTLDGLTSQTIGLTARGEVDMDHPESHANGEIHLHTQDLSRVPYLAGRAGGRMDLDAVVAMQLGALQGHVDVDARNIRSSAARADRAEMHGSIAGTTTAPRMDLSLRGDGVTPSGYAPMNVRASIAGNPLHAIDGSVHVQTVAASPSTARTAFHGSVQVRIDPDAIRIHLPVATIALNGAQGNVAGDVSIPRGEGTRVAHAHIGTSDGGLAEVNLNGAQISARFQAFSLGWLSRASGNQIALTGLLDGTLALGIDHPASPRASLRWTGGRVPYLGDFGLTLRADHQGTTDTIDSWMDFAANPNTPGDSRRSFIHATVRAVPPQHLGDQRAWLRGIEDLRVEMANISVRSLEGALPPEAKIRGTLDALLVANRPSRGVPLTVMLGFDVRRAQLAREMPRYVPPSLEAMLPPAARSRTFTESLRLRAAVCSTLDEHNLDRGVPVAVDLAFGREVGEPPIPLPNRCESPTAQDHSSQVRDPYLQARVTLDGPWVTMAKTLMRESATFRNTPHATLAQLHLSDRAKSLLTETHLGARIDLGAIGTDRWPLTGDAHRIFPALAQPPFAGQLTADLELTGALISPVVDLHAALDVHDHPVIAGPSRIAAQLSSHFAASRSGGFILDEIDANAELRATLKVGPPNQLRDSGSINARLNVGGALARILDPAETRSAITRRHFQIEGTGLALGQLSWAHAHELDGLVALNIRDTPDPRLPVLAEVTMSNLRAHGSPAVGAGIAARIEETGSAWSVHTCAAINTSPTTPAPCHFEPITGSIPRGSLHADAVLPFTGDILSPSPQLNELVVNLAADHVRIDPVSPFIEGDMISRLGGELTARFGWRAASARELHGEMHLTDGVVGLAMIGRPAREMVMDLRDDGRHVTIDRLSLKMGDGTLQTHGTIDVSPDPSQLGNLSLQVETWHLPVGDEGANYGALTSRLDLQATATPDHLGAQVHIHTSRMELPQFNNRDVQDMSADPNVVILRRENGNPRLAENAAAPFGLDLDINTDSPLVITRDDLFFALRAGLHIHKDISGVAIGGNVDVALRQSWFELLGTRFYFDRARITFNNSTQVDPSLDVAAHNDSPSAGRINIFVTHRLSAPVIRFASEQFPDADESQVLSLLVLGRRDSNGPSDQSNVTGQAESAIGGLVAGFGAGLLTNSARQHFDFLPRLILEPGSNGLGSGRYGAGATEFNGRLYVEGTYGGVQDYSGVNSSVAGQTGNATQEFRGLVEYSLSPHWSVSGEVSTANRFGADILWAPIQ